MNLTAERIKEAVLMPELLQRYGLELNRHNAMLCPFHAEDTPSFTVYADGKRFHCFGCGVDGTVIDFVMRLFSLTFAEAIVRLQSDFGLLGGTAMPETKHKGRNAARKRQRQEGWEIAREAHRLASTPPPTGLPPEDSAWGTYASGLGRLEYLDYCLERGWTP